MVNENWKLIKIKKEKFGKPNVVRQLFYCSVTGASIITARQSQFGGVYTGGTGSKLSFATGALACTLLLHTHTHTSQTRLAVVVSGGLSSKVARWHYYNIIVRRVATVWHSLLKTLPRPCNLYSYSVHPTLTHYTCIIIINNNILSARCTCTGRWRRDPLALLQLTARPGVRGYAFARRQFSNFVFSAVPHPRTLVQKTNVASLIARARVNVVCFCASFAARAHAARGCVCGTCFSVCWCVLRYS